MSTTNKQVTVGEAVNFQLDSDDTDCSQGLGKVTQVIGMVVAIELDEPVGDVTEVHRVIVGCHLMIKDPNSES